MSKSVERALELLAVVAAEPMGSGELAVRLGVHESTASRLVQTLERQRFVKREPDRRIRLGSRMFALAYLALDGLDVRRVAAPHLLRLNEITGHTVHLGEYEAGEVTYIDKVDSRRPIRMYSRIGAVAPLHCTAVAKAIVGFLPASARERLVDGTVYTPYTETTIRTPEAYLAELRLTEQRGYATDMREHEASIECIAAPIHAADGSVRHSVSIAAPAVATEDLSKFVDLLLQTTALVSKELGWDENGLRQRAEVTTATARSVR